MPGLNGIEVVRALSARERDVLLLLVVEASTVRSHLARMLPKVVPGQAGD
jgi:CheY-like chemotaxis protein